MSALIYGFVLESVPDVRTASLEDIEQLYAESSRLERGFKFQWRLHNNKDEEEESCDIKVVPKQGKKKKANNTTAKRV